MAVNHTVIQGRQVRDCEMRTTESGIENITFTLAWSKKYKEREMTLYQKCKAWRFQAKIIGEHLNKKGQEFIVEGYLETEKWQDKDGNNHSENVLMVEDVHFCGKKQDNGSTAQVATNAPATSAPAGGGFVEVPESELPF